MSGESLNAKYEALQAERARTMAPADLAANIRQREHLVANADRGNFPKPGDVVPDFNVTEADAGPLTSRELLARGPVVVLFFRFATCPACNIALPHYAQTLAPELTARGATLLALSPQIPEKLREIKTRHNLPFLVATDADNTLARHFGLTFLPTPEARANAEAKGNDLGATIGTGSWELPMPAVIVIGQDRTVTFADVSPDWLKRTEAKEVLAALPEVTSAQ
ncbi:MAG TPA: peroxiredoxin-like family protein [Acidocella sp.]|nr:peroxiredoxin-like family protein [Acidocella sp.]